MSLDPAEAVSGVPQDPALGPLLFNRYQCFR
jgi:hypothetical protein